MQTSSSQRGFTLIELMLSMAFIGMLLIATVATITQVTNLYSKGITFKLINQAGRDLGSAIKRDASSATGIANPLVQPDVTHNGNLGRLCLGAYSYVWSSPGALRAGSATRYADTPDKQIVMARVADGGGSLCLADPSGNYATVINQDDATEMLPNDKGDYALHDMQYRRIPDGGGAIAGARLYDVTYKIGTNQQGTIDSAIRCEPPNQATNNFNFCAVNNFEIMIQMGY